MMQNIGIRIKGSFPDKGKAGNDCIEGPPAPPKAGILSKVFIVTKLYTIIENLCGKE
jgi:hypothetical protein